MAAGKRHGVVAQRGSEGNRLGLAGLGLAAILGGCARPGCVLPAQSRVTLVTLFFGRDIPGGGQVSDADWARFAAGSITDRFPDGFTVSDGTGQWRDPATGRIGREPTKIVLIAVPDAAPGLAARIRSVTDAYRARFRQEAVGVVSAEACGAF